MWYCEDCDREFNSEWGLTQHFTHSSYHYYCEFCDEHFDDEASLEQHDEYNRHGYCDWCNEVRILAFNSTDCLIEFHNRTQPGVPDGG